LHQNTKRCREGVSAPVEVTVKMKAYFTLPTAVYQFQCFSCF